MTGADRRRWDGVDRRRPPILHIGARVVAHGRTWWVRAIQSRPDSQEMTVEMRAE